MKKRRKTRVTKQQVIDLREAKKNRPKTNKKTAAPGPWTCVEVDFTVPAYLRPTESILGTCTGTYPVEAPYSVEKGWYPVLFNVTSPEIALEVAAHGVDQYLAACEKALNTPENKERYGTLIILKASIDNSLDPDPEARFISCRGKTNKKTIIGFCGWRQDKYLILKGSDGTEEEQCKTN